MRGQSAGKAITLSNGTVTNLLIYIGGSIIGLHSMNLPNGYIVK